MLRELRDAKGIVYKILESSIRRGKLTFIEPAGIARCFGSNSSSADPEAAITVLDERMFGRVLRDGSLGLGESYMEGWWEAQGEQLCAFIGVLWINEIGKYLRESMVAKAGISAARLLRFSPSRLITASEAVRHHYDAGEDLFSCFLDSSMTYSGGYCVSPDDDLSKMQLQKHGLISKKLRMESARSILDIGCGWGGMLFYLAENFPTLKCRGISISVSQVGFVERRIELGGYSGRVEVALQDYRESRGRYERIVSIGMLEHVGRSNYAKFAKRLGELLADDGYGLIQTISIADEVRRSGSDPWVEKYIFPGGQLPRLGDLVEHLDRARLEIMGLENCRESYARTLHHWSSNLARNQERALASVRNNERIIRMWHYYLRLFESGFRYGNYNLYQILFRKRVGR